MNLSPVFCPRLYGQTVVKHILTGKAVPRANVVHILMVGALMIILLEFSFAKCDLSIDLGVIKNL